MWNQFVLLWLMNVRMSPIVISFAVWVRYALKGQRKEQPLSLNTGDVFARETERQVCRKAAAY